MISGSALPSGYSIKTEGLSLKYPRNRKIKIILLDTAGFETPLKERNFCPLINNLPFKDALKKIEEIARDKQLTEFFLQNFVIKESNILIVVVGQLTYTDQKLLNRIKINCQNNKRLFVVHNLINLVTIEQVENYIDDVLMQSLTFKLKKNNYIHLCNESQTGNQVYFTEEIYDEDSNEASGESSQEVIHLILAFDKSEAGEYYNKFTIDYLKSQIECHTKLKEFPVIERVKNHLLNMSKDIMETPFQSSNDIIYDDKVFKVKEKRDFVLKRCLVDELGFSNFYGKKFSPKYCYELKEKEFIISIELSGEINNFLTKILTIGDLYSIQVSGQKLVDSGNGDIKFSNRSDGYFLLDIRLPISELPLKEKKVIKTEKANGLVKLYYPLQEQVNETCDIDFDN